MLSYQHIYHAGNPVDCQKHVMLSALLTQLDGFHYIDTHSGRGLYDLTAPEAQKIAEFRQGIDVLWPLADWPSHIATYQHLLEDLNQSGVCDTYPGSPMVAYAHAKDGDTIDLYEIHPRELDALVDAMDGLPFTTIHDTSGWSILENGLPVMRTQGVILIDPSYELKDEYDAMAERITRALQQWPQAIVLLWYPILSAARHVPMVQNIANTISAPILQNEIMLDGQKGLQGTGLLIVNPPQGFDATVTHLADWLTTAIGTSCRTEWLRTP